MPNTLHPGSRSFLSDELYRIVQSGFTRSRLANCVWRIGWEPWEPYQYLDENKQLVGLDIELIQSVANIAGCKTKYIKIASWKRNLIELAKGNLDLAIAASKTVERQEFAQFVYSNLQDYLTRSVKAAPPPLAKVYFIGRGQNPNKRKDFKQQLGKKPPWLAKVKCYQCHKYGHFKREN